jgi:hypothetical protein
MLFEEKDRTLIGPRSYVEGDWEYLDRSARVEAQRVRMFLTEWVTKYPAEHRNEIITRITNGDQHNFQSYGILGTPYLIRSQYLN